MNKRGISDVIVFVGVAVALLLLAPILLKITNEVLDPLESQLGNISSAAGEGVATVHDSFVTFWDWLIAIAFLVDVILLFVFAFMAGPHPIFALFYLIGSVITLMFAKYIAAPVSTIFGMSEFDTEVLQLPIVNFIVTRFDIIILGIIIVTGIIMYSSFKREGGFTR